MKLYTRPCFYLPESVGDRTAGRIVRQKPVVWLFKEEGLVAWIIFFFRKEIIGEQNKKYLIKCAFIFRLWGEPVNLREQHDALEFFNSLVDSLDEALKALGHPAMLSKVLGGSFADQKICQGCPHR